MNTSRRFKPGDKVRCIDAVYSANRLTVGTVYTVSNTIPENRIIELETLKTNYWAEDRFELVTEEAPVAKREFKVGDKVKIINADGGSARRLYTGSTGNIHEWHSTYPDVKFSDGSVVTFHISRLELVEATEPTLEQLVAKANEGVDAIRELHRKYAGEAQFESSFRPLEWEDVWPATTEHCGVGKYRIKPKPAFTPFETSNGWKVRLEGERLFIGCQSFEKNITKIMLERMLKNSTSFRNGQDEFFGTRKGISYKGNVLPWADADRLLAELEKAGVA